MQWHVVPVEKPEHANVILGQAHFIKTVEDLHEAMAGAGGAIRFGIAFNEASGPCLVRHSGNDPELVRVATDNARRIGAGHVFVIVMEEGFPINVLNAIKQVPEVCGIYCATANPCQVVVAETDQGRGVMGVVDGQAVKGVETEQDVQDRKALLRRFGYKL
ncbi:adenosine-specific kinase [Carboxydochorda subterranea]|uniref:Adenosine-specific kinase n=1 Tax=Carboxydichorda subterranea TaxID=3109565 RepID=A0ABZ1BYY5_9FIRM|nr:adenosine-specific kinase [Limnochorda sp. L945t]WRP17808.1 adenosine-specific kinase [Limnochorda sp. L945t]